MNRAINLLSESSSGRLPGGESDVERLSSPPYPLDQPWPAQLPSRQANSVEPSPRHSGPQVAPAPNGLHLLADLHGVAPGLLGDAPCMESLLRQAATTAGARVLFSHFHVFGAGGEGQGITGVVLLAESHVSIHTWPEHGFAAIDIFMCGAARPQVALGLICAALQPHDCIVRDVLRGAQQAPAALDGPARDSDSA